MASTFPFIVREHTIPASHIREYARATSNSQDDTFQLHIKQYIPKDSPNPRKGDVTIIGAHANGFPKELYEPLWEDFHREASSRGIRIRAIWIADTAWQGQSGILNASKLGNDPNWYDYARDIVHMINTFRMPRPLIGMGHSFGGNALTHVALLHPRLLTTLVLLDPVISRWAATPAGIKKGPAAASVGRRDRWPSREAAAEAFGRSKFYQGWDPRVLKLWNEYGIMDDGEGVTLTTTKHQEVFTYYRPSWPGYDAEGKRVVDTKAVPDLDESLNTSHPTWPFYRPESPNTLFRLPNVRPGILFVFGGGSDLSPKELQEEKLTLAGTGVGGSGGVKAGRVKAVVSEKHGHLVPMEVPGGCAKAAAEWVGGEMGSWWEEEREYEEWTRRSQGEKTEIGDEFKRYIGRPDRPKAKM